MQRYGFRCLSSLPSTSPPYRTSALSAHHTLHLVGAPTAVGLLAGARAEADDAVARRERRGAAGATADRGGGGGGAPKT
jgi:hypothetical protein